MVNVEYDEDDDGMTVTVESIVSHTLKSKE